MCCCPDHSAALWVCCRHVYWQHIEQALGITPLQPLEGSLIAAYWHWIKMHLGMVISYSIGFLFGLRWLNELCGSSHEEKKYFCTRTIGGSCQNNHLSASRAQDLQKAFSKSSINEYEDFLLEEGLVGRDVILQGIESLLCGACF